jgi:hypothetical protein
MPLRVQLAGEGSKSAPARLGKTSSRQCFCGIEQLQPESQPLRRVATIEMIRGLVGKAAATKRSFRLQGLESCPGGLIMSQ